MSGVKSGGNKTAILVGLIAVVAIAVALIIGIAATRQGISADSTPLITTVLGFCGLIVAQLLTLLKTEETKQAIHNGHLVGKVKQALTEYHDGPETTYYEDDKEGDPNG